MARSVVELLPRPFAELTLEDVQTIISQPPGEPRETLWLERKATVTPNSLSKACAAFANTYGGLLVVGVADEGDGLVGIDPIPEPELWVKDVLRGNLLPMPPFRARWIPTGDSDRGVLLVLVEHSSTTPHLMVRNGAIYVRNPGSSDPVPIEDQRRLLDLTARGERATERAANRARELSAERITYYPDYLLPEWEPSEIFVLAPTGVSASFEERLFDKATPPAISQVVWGPAPSDPRSREQRCTVWAQHHIAIRRQTIPAISFNDETTQEGVVVTRDGTVRIARGKLGWDLDRRGALTVTAELRPYFANALRAAREVLTEYGGHGDLRLVYRLDLREDSIWFEDIPGVGSFKPQRILAVEIDTTFDDETTDDRVFAELLRAVGYGPIEA